MPMNAPFLEGFERRMQFVAMAEAIVRRTGRNMDLERFFADNELDSLIMAVLVFAMEETLAENRDCTMERITRFLAELLTDVKPEFPSERVRDLAEYIVKTVLRNDGEPRYYTLLHPEKGFQRIRVEFLADTKEETPTSFRIHYQLTDQAYDFLFRTKEVESELRFTMEELKLRELIRRKNYGKAIRQSANLTQMIRQKKRELHQFLERVRDNVLGIDVGEFEALYGSTFELLQDEYGIMREIRAMLQLAYEHLRNEMALRDTLDVEMAKALSEMDRIRLNLDWAVAEQQAMIHTRHSVSDLYAGIMNEAFTRRVLNRFDLGETVLKPMLRMEGDALNHVFDLLKPLFLPDPPRWLGIGSLYAPQQKLRSTEEAEPGIPFTGLEVDVESERQLRASSFHDAFTAGLLQYAARHPEGFRLDAFCAWFEENGGLRGEAGDLDAQTSRNLLFQNAMRLYEARLVDVAAWRKERPEVVENGVGEFDLEACLYHVERIRPDLYGIRRLQMGWPDGALFETVSRMERNGAMFESRETVSNLWFEVEKE